jgi:hypothetical protein
VELIKEKYLNRLEKGYRVWTESGFHGHGHDKVNVPPQTAGTVIEAWQEFRTIEQLLYKVEWDSRQISIHYACDLLAIGSFRDLAEFQAYAAANAVLIREVKGPNGGLRGAKVILKNGDWIEGLGGLESNLPGVPREIHVLPRKRFKRNG